MNITFEYNMAVMRARQAEVIKARQAEKSRSAADIAGRGSPCADCASHPSNAFWSGNGHENVCDGNNSHC